MVAVGDKLKGVKLTEEETSFLSELFANNYQSLCDYARYSLDAVHYDDLVQNTFLIAALKIKTLMQNLNPTGWLFLTLKNVARTDRRDRKIIRYWADSPVIPDDIFTLDSFEEDAIFTMTRKEWLTQDEWNLLDRYYCQGYTSKELAETMGISPEACRKRVARAKSRLAKALDRNTIDNDVKGRKE